MQNQDQVFQIKLKFEKSWKLSAIEFAFKNSM